MALLVPEPVLDRESFSAWSSRKLLRTELNGNPTGNLFIQPERFKSTGSFHIWRN